MLSTSEVHLFCHNIWNEIPPPKIWMNPSPILQVFQKVLKPWLFTLAFGEKDWSPPPACLIFGVACVLSSFPSLCLPLSPTVMCCNGIKCWLRKLFGRVYVLLVCFSEATWPALREKIMLIYIEFDPAEHLLFSSYVFSTFSSSNVQSLCLNWIFWLRILFCLTFENFCLKSN